MPTESPRQGTATVPVPDQLGWKLVDEVFWTSVLTLFVGWHFGLVSGLLRNAPEWLAEAAVGITIILWFEQCRRMVRSARQYAQRRSG